MRRFPAGRDFLLGRLGAARSRLLGAAGLRDLAARATPGERMAALGPTLWSPAVRAGSVEEAESALEARARGECSAALADLEPRVRALVRAFLLPDDARALRGALRAQARALPPERVAMLLDPTPTLDLERLRAIASCPDVAAAAGRLASWGSPLAVALHEAGADVRKPGALAALEAALDGAARDALRRAARGPGADRRALRDLASARADLSAAATLLALATGGGGAGAPIVGGDRLDPPTVDRLSRLPAAELPAALAAELRDLLGDPARSTPALSGPALADHRLGRALVRHARRLARSAPFTVAVPCAWLVEVREELRRVRLVLRATAEGVPPPVLLDLLEA
jgi:hypothetical protein